MQKNNVLETLIEGRDRANGMIDFHQRRMKETAENLRRTRIRHESEITAMNNSLQADELSLQEWIADTARYEAAIRVLRLNKIAGDPDAVEALGPMEEADGKNQN
jgi:hypothetical protein